jgi:hypothetical protein
LFIGANFPAAKAMSFAIGAKNRTWEFESNCPAKKRRQRRILEPDSFASFAPSRDTLLVARPRWGVHGRVFVLRDWSIQVLQLERWVVVTENDKIFWSEKYGNDLNGGRAGVDREGHGVDTPAMSTMAEIEAAIEQLPPAQMEALAMWLAARRARRAETGGGSDPLASLAGSWQEDPAFDAAVLAFEQVDEAMWR